VKFLLSSRLRHGKEKAQDSDSPTRFYRQHINFSDWDPMSLTDYLGRLQLLWKWKYCRAIWLYNRCFPIWKRRTSCWSSREPLPLSSPPVVQNHGILEINNKEVYIWCHMERLWLWMRTLWFLKFDGVSGDQTVLAIVISIMSLTLSVFDGLDDRPLPWSLTHNGDS